MESETSLAGLLPVLVAGVPDLLDEVAAGLRELDEEYAEFLLSGRDEVVPAAEYAMGQLVAEAQECLGRPGVPVEAAAGSGGPVDVAWALFEEVGRDQWRRDLPVRTLLSAYQLGGRVAWRRIAAVARGVGVSADGLVALAEAVFRLVDELSAATIAGFVAEQAASVSARERAREALAERLLSDRADRGAVAAAARAAGWPVPATAAVVVLRPGDEVGVEVLGSMTPSCLVVRRGVWVAAIVPDPEGPGRRARLAAALSGTTAVIGPGVPPDRLPESAAVAEVTAATLGARAGEGPVFATEVLDAVIVRRDRRLLELLQAEALAPLAGAAPGSQAALRATLRSYLLHLGNRQKVSAELGVHPQTVRYRLGRLAELFGPVLDDPAGRLRLMLALAWSPDPDHPVEQPADIDAGSVLLPTRAVPRPEPSAAEYLSAATAWHDGGADLHGPALHHPATAGSRTEGDDAAARGR